MKQLIKHGNKSLLFLAPLFLIIFALLFVVMKMDRNHKFNQQKTQYLNLSTQIQDVVHDHILEIHKDLTFLAAEISLSKQQLNPTEFDHTILQKFELFVSNKHRYAQIRLLDLSGQETHRVNFKDDQAQVVMAKNLQNKSSRYYFKEAQKLVYGKVYQSPLDLNVERGEVVLPIEPTIRFATPVKDANNQIFAYLFINYNAENMLKPMLDRLQKVNTHFYFVNKDGYPIISSNPALNWGFMFNKPETNLQAQLPQLYQALTQSPKHSTLVSVAGHDYVVKNFCGLKKCQTNSQNQFTNMDANDMPWRIIIDLDGYFNNSPWWLNNWAYFILFLLVVLAILGINVTSRLVSSVDKLQNQELELKDSNTRFQQILESVPEGMVVVNDQGLIEEANYFTEELFEINRLDLIGKPIEYLINGLHAADHHKKVIDFFDAPRKLNPTKEKPYPVTTFKSKSIRLIDVKLDFFEFKNHFFALVMIQDVTEQHRLQENLKQSQKLEALGNLTGGIAHDFNNMLGIISGNIQLLEMQEAQNPKALEKLGKLRKATKSASDLTQKLLSISRKKAMSIEPLDLTNFAQDIHELLQRIVKLDTTLHFSSESCLPVINSDENELTNAIINLVVNARDAMPSGGDIFVHFKSVYLGPEYVQQHDENMKPGDYAFIGVSDTGHGIPAEILDKIFEPFFTTKPQGKGTGLGLAMIYGFVKQSKGHIKVYSEVGRGTSIHIYLPVAEENNKKIVQRNSLAETDTTLVKGKRALVVDDEKELAEVAASFLLNAEMECDIVFSGEQALEAIKNKHYDIVVSDIVMPGKYDGLALLHQMPQISPNTAIVLTSGFSEELIKKQYLSQEDFFFVMKPYKYEEIIAVTSLAIQAKE